MQLAEDKQRKSYFRSQATVLLDQAEGIKSTKKWLPKPGEDLISFPSLTPTALSGGTINATSDSQQVDPSSNKKSTPNVNPNSVQRGRKIPTAENILLYRSSRFYGGPYPPWDEAVQLEPNAVHRAPPGILESGFNLAPAQLEILHGWKRPDKALPPPHFLVSGQTDGPPTMKPDSRTDFVQDITTDCSVVASMCACMAREDKGFPTLLSGIIYPFDAQEGVPLVSASGKYILRLNFNGCFRKVWLDDHLPVSINNRLLHVIDRNNPRLLWPALLEKAYLQIRGGYDFPGSNSGTDLWILTGWLPEQVFLHYDTDDPDETWKRMHDGFKEGTVLITIGTGDLSKTVEDGLGLIGHHDYAILDLKEAQDGRKYMLVKNPWLNGPIWKSRDKSIEEDAKSIDQGPNGVSSTTLELQQSQSDYVQAFFNEDDVPVLGSFWIPFSEALQNFESLYLNWNPNIFKYRADIHFEWDLASNRSPSSSARTNPQFSVTSKQSSTVWLILSRHFTDRPDGCGRDVADQSFLSLFAFKNAGHRVIANRHALQNTFFVDTPQTLMKLDVVANEPVTIAPAEQELPLRRYTFSLSVFSWHHVLLEKAKEHYTDTFSIEGYWTEETAGGNSDCSTYLQNPQYSLRLPAATRLSIVLETHAEDISVHVKLVHGKGKRVEQPPRRQDIVIESGQYRQHCVIASTNTAYAHNQLTPGPVDDEETVPKGDYTIIVSTFNPQELGEFTLSVMSDCNASLNRIPRSGAGRLLARLADVSFASSVRRVAAPIVVHRMVKVYFVVRRINSINVDLMSDTEACAGPASPVRITVQSSLGPNPHILLASAGGVFQDADPDRGGVRTEDAHLVATRAGRGKDYALYITLERMTTESQRSEERYSVEALADMPGWGEVGLWRASDPPL